MLEPLETELETHRNTMAAGELDTSAFDWKSGRKINKELEKWNKIS